MKEKKKLSVIKTVRMSEDLNKDIVHSATELDIAEQDIIRLAIRVGLEHLRRIKYDLTKAIVDTAEFEGDPDNPANWEYKNPDKIKTQMERDATLHRLMAGKKKPKPAGNSKIA